MGALSYRDASCRLSLAQAVEQFYAGQPRLARPASAGADREVLGSHDAVHVMFGLGTRLRDEMAADLAAVLATDVGLRRYAGCLAASPEARAQTRDALTHPLGLLLATVGVVPVGVRLVWRAARRRPRWPWQVPAVLLDRPLRELRVRYAIPVLAPRR